MRGAGFALVFLLVACGGIADGPRGEAASPGAVAAGGAGSNGGPHGSGGQAGAGSGGQASAHGQGGNAGAGCEVRAADFDRSCASDADCVEVGDGDGCASVCAFACHQGGAINQSAEAAYYEALAHSAIDVSSAHCLCVTAGPPCCQAGLCQNGVTCAASRRDAAACVESGGACEPGQACCAADFICQHGVCLGELH